jgi:hypothetical protein
MQKKYPDGEYGDMARYNSLKIIRHQKKIIMGLKADNCNRLE